jgi:hypothetical protein
MAKSTRSPMAKYFADSVRMAKDRAKRSYFCEFNEEVTENFLMDLYASQNGKCALTGDTMELTRGGDWNGGKNPRGCSIDRKDPSQGYYIDNIQLACTRWNVLKGNMTMTQWIELAQSMSALFSNK